MDTSSLVNLYDRLDAQKKTSNTTSNFNFSDDNPEMELPADVPSAVQNPPATQDRLPAPSPAFTPTLRPPAQTFYKFEPDQMGGLDKSLDDYKANFDTNWNKDIDKNCHKIKDKCCKKIILDIYCKIIPLDNHFVKHHHGLMSQDVDNFLAKKGMDGYSYMTAAKESTKAPLLSYLLNIAEAASYAYYEAAAKEKKENGEKGIHLPPKDPTIADEEKVDEQLVDAKNDLEYKEFIHTLKKKTMDKIVNDVSNLISDKKDEKNMTFDPKKGQSPNKKVAGVEDEKIIDDEGATKTTESKEVKEDDKKKVIADSKAPEVKKEVKPEDKKVTGTEPPKEEAKEDTKDAKKEEQKATDEKKESVLSVCIDYANRYLVENNIMVTSELNEKVIALAIRESTLMQLDRVFNLSKRPNLLNLKTDLYLNKGSIMNESGIKALIK